jgi:hypothetical protein
MIPSVKGSRLVSEYDCNNVVSAKGGLKINQICDLMLLLQANNMVFRLCCWLSSLTEQKTKKVYECMCL